MSQSVDLFARDLFKRVRQNVRAAWLYTPYVKAKANVRNAHRHMLYAPDQSWRLELVNPERQVSGIFQVPMLTSNGRADSIAWTAVAAQILASADAVQLSDDDRLLKNRLLQDAGHYIHRVGLHDIKAYLHDSSVSLPDTASSASGICTWLAQNLSNLGQAGYEQITHLAAIAAGVFTQKATQNLPYDIERIQREICSALGLAKVPTKPRSQLDHITTPSRSDSPAPDSRNIKNFEEMGNRLFDYFASVKLGSIHSDSLKVNAYLPELFKHQRQLSAGLKSRTAGASTSNLLVSKLATFGKSAFTPKPLTNESKAKNLKLTSMLPFIANSSELLNVSDFLSSTDYVLDEIKSQQAKWLREGKRPNSNGLWNLITTGTWAGFKRERLESDQRWVNDVSTRVKELNVFATQHGLKDKKHDVLVLQAQLGALEYQQVTRSFNIEQNGERPILQTRQFPQGFNIDTLREMRSETLIEFDAMSAVASMRKKADLARNPTLRFDELYRHGEEKYGEALESAIASCFPEIWHDKINHLILEFRGMTTLLSQKEFFNRVANVVPEKLEYESVRRVYKAVSAYKHFFDAYSMTKDACQQRATLLGSDAKVLNSHIANVKRHQQTEIQSAVRNHDLVAKIQKCRKDLLAKQAELTQVENAISGRYAGLCNLLGAVDANQLTNAGDLNGFVKMLQTNFKSATTEEKLHFEKHSFSRTGEELLPVYSKKVKLPNRRFAEGDRRLMKNTEHMTVKFPFAANLSKLLKVVVPKQAPEAATLAMKSDVGALLQAVNEHNKPNKLKKLHEGYVQKSWWRWLFTSQKTIERRKSNDYSHLSTLRDYLSKADGDYAKSGPQVLVCLWRVTIPEWLATLPENHQIDNHLIQQLTQKCKKYQPYQSTDLVLPADIKAKKAGVRFSADAQLEKVQVIDSVWSKICEFARRMGSKEDLQHIIAEFGCYYKTLPGREEWPVDDPHRYYDCHPSFKRRAIAYADKIGSGATDQDLLEEFGCLLQPIESKVGRFDRDDWRLYYEDRKFNSTRPRCFKVSSRMNRYDDSAKTLPSYDKRLKAFINLSQSDCEKQDVLDQVTGKISASCLVPKFQSLLTDYISKRTIQLREHRNAGYLAGVQMVGHINPTISAMNLRKALELNKGLSAILSQPFDGEYDLVLAVRHLFKQKFDKVLSKGGQLFAMIKTFKTFMKECDEKHHQAAEVSSVSSHSDDDDSPMSGSRAAVSFQSGIGFVSKGSPRVAHGPHPVSRRASVDPVPASSAQAPFRKGHASSVSSEQGRPSPVSPL